MQLTFHDGIGFSQMLFNEGLFGYAAFCALIYRYVSSQSIYLVAAELVSVMRASDWFNRW